MAAFLFLLVLAAIAGVLGAVLKAVALIVLGVIAAIAIAGWVAWRSLRRALEQQARAGGTIGGSTTITIGRARREQPGLDPPAPRRDDRY